MKNKQLVIMVALTAMAFGSALAADITNGGTGTPIGGIAQNTAQNVAGNRPVAWNTLQIHSLVGQSFTATADETADSISLKLDKAEDFALHDTASFRLKLFQGIDSTATLLGSYAYDATGLGSAIAGEWISFGLDAGVALTSGTAYSFLLVCGAEDPEHITYFERTKTVEDYVGGAELRGGNTYDIYNWETDPWDVATPVGSRVVPQAGHLLFSVNKLISENLPPVANDISKTILLNSPVDITLSGSDLNGDPLVFTVETFPTNGTLTGTSPDLTYTPDTDYVGADSFTYIANDGTTNSELATVSITVLYGSGLMVSVGADDPAVGNTNLVGTSDAGASREVIRTDSQTFAIGQSFTLAESKTVSEIYLQSANSKDFSSFVGGVEIKVFSGEGATATLMHTSIFDVTVNDQDGDDVALGDWVRFSLQDSGVALPAGANSFLVFWSQKSGVDAENKWGFSRNKTDGYSGGMQYEYPIQAGDAYPQWDTDPWDSVTSIPANDLTFYINSGKSTLTPPEIYAAWAAQNGANADVTIDTDFDGMDDLLEYALGGNPTTNDAAAILPTSEAAGDWLYYIYNRRDDAADRGLTYEVLSGTDLVFNPIANATEYVGASAAVEGFESVTNRVSTTTEGKQFMQLEVELTD